jgi:hypothetical protein
MFCGHDAIMEQQVPCFQDEIRLPYSNWPTTNVFAIPDTVPIEIMPRDVLAGAPARIDESRCGRFGTPPPIPAFGDQH